MMFDKWPQHDAATLEPDLTWKVWKGPRFVVQPVWFEGTLDEVVERVGALRDAAPIKPHYLTGRTDAHANYYLHVEKRENEQLRVRLHLYVLEDPEQEDRPTSIREGLRAAILDEMARPDEFKLAY